MIGRMRRTKARSPDGRTGTRRVPASCLLAVLSLLLLVALVAALAVSRIPRDDSRDELGSLPRQVAP